nr:hypothetical protein [uncultured Blautia sp.]
MTKFEIGKRYKDGAMTIEVLKRTVKTLKVAIIAHAGRTNEKVREIKKVKINNWDTEEVIFIHDCYELHA